jgi:hypothetical protein
MPAADYSFSIEKGTSFYISFDYKDDTQTPINLTNWCARLRWIDSNGETKTFITDTTNSDYQFTIDPLIGRLIFKLPAEATASYTWSTASYDLELQEPNDLYNGGGKRVFRILQGTISLIVRNVPGDDAFTCVTDTQDPCNTCQ